MDDVEVGHGRVALRLALLHLEFLERRPLGVRVDTEDLSRERQWCQNIVVAVSASCTTSDVSCLMICCSHLCYYHVISSSYFTHIHICASNNIDTSLEMKLGKGMTRVYLNLMGVLLSLAHCHLVRTMKCWLYTHGQVPYSSSVPQYLKAHILTCKPIARHLGNRERK